MRGARFEKWYPVLLGFLSLAFLPSAPWIQRNHSLVAAAISKLFSPVLNLSAIAIGFLATSQSILISLKDSAGVIKMQADGYYEIFVNFLSIATTLSFLLAIFSGLFSALDFTKLDKCHGYLQVLWLALCFVTVGSYYRAVSLLPYVLRGTIPRCATKPNKAKPFNPNL
jgi:hypothetical protein